MMEYTKSPRRYVAELIDSIELRVIQLPAPAIFGITWIEPGTAGDSVTEVGSLSSTGDSSRTLNPFWPKWRHWVAYVQNWWGTRVAPYVPPDADLRDYLGKKPCSFVLAILRNLGYLSRRQKRTLGAGAIRGTLEQKLKQLKDCCLDAMRSRYPIIKTES